MTKTKKHSIKEFFSSFKDSVDALITLVRMQLKEKMDISYTRSARAMIFKIVWLLVEFAAITAVLTVAFYFIKLLGIFSLIHDIPVSVISLVFSVMLLLSLITDTLGLMKALYFSKDNTVLLTFPATPSLVFFSKLAVYYVYELRKSFMFIIPMFIAFGISKGYSTLYYPWLMLMFLLISTIPVLLSALISIPTMFIQMFLNRVKVLQYALYAIMVGLGIVLLWTLIGLIPEDINFVETWGQTYWDIQNFLKGYTKAFPWLYAFTELIVGKTVGLNNIIFHSETLNNLLIVVGIAIVLLLLCFLCSKPLFCKMAATPFEFKKSNRLTNKPNRRRTVFISALCKEWISGIRSNYFIKHAGIVVVIMPMAIHLLNKIYSAMNTRYLGTQMTVCFNVLIILLIVLMTNIDMASVYSRDGSSSYLNKVQPAPYSVLLFSKLFFPMIITFIGTVFTMVIFAQHSSLGTVDLIMLTVTIYGIYVAHVFSSAESDIMNPQYEQYATFNEQANNPNETNSGVLAILISFIVFIFSLFLSSNTTSGVWAKLAVVAVAMAIFKASTYLMKIKAFYKEK
jgi:hypothetical protein